MPTHRRLKQQLKQQQRTSGQQMFAASQRKPQPHHSSVTALELSPHQQRQRPFLSQSQSHLALQPACPLPRVLSFAHWLPLGRPGEPQPAHGCAADPLLPQHRSHLPAKATVTVQMCLLHQQMMPAGPGAAHLVIQETARQQRPR